MLELTLWQVWSIEPPYEKGTARFHGVRSRWNYINYDDPDKGGAIQLRDKVLEQYRDLNRPECPTPALVFIKEVRAHIPASRITFLTGESILGEDWKDPFGRKKKKFVENSPL